MKRKKKRTLALVTVAVFLLVFGLCLELNDYGSCEKRLAGTRTTLALIRTLIQKHRQQTGSYPYSLAELRKSVQAKERGGDKIPECISSGEGTSRESSTLDGTGGWYYNSDRGEVKINLTKPVKHYFRLYFGPLRNEIPADW